MSPRDFTTPGTFTVWLRGYPSNAARDSAYLGLAGQVLTVTGVAPAQWSWAKGQAAELVVPQSGLYTLTLWLREDGLRVDRLLLTTDTTYLPTGFGPVESMQQTAQMTGALTTLTRTINYGYDDLYRLTQASYTSGESYQYTYDPVGNRLQQIIDGDTTTYLYDAANRLTSVDGVGYTFDNNGNLLATGLLTNTFDASNRLLETTRAGTTLQPSYNGLGNRVGQTVGLSTTTFALDVQGLPEVISTSAGNAYLHLPGVIVAENAAGERRFLLPDGLGSVRQAVDESGAVVVYNEFDPYGNPILNSSFLISNYGFTGEWWEDEVGLLYLRARWYRPETGSFLSRDPVAGEPAYLYARGNPVNLVDPSGYFSYKVIERSLGDDGNIGEAFAGRLGLLQLLLDAKTGDLVAPLQVDFSMSHGPHLRYPLKAPQHPAYGTVYCNSSSGEGKLEFTNGLSGAYFNKPATASYTLKEYIDRIRSLLTENFILQYGVQKQHSYITIH